MVLIAEEHGEQSDNGGEELSVVVVKEKPRRPPHNFISIVTDAHRPFDTSSLEKICRQLYDGVLLREKMQKYWVDRESNKNCFMVLARDLAIVWGGDPQYWDWATYQESVDKEEIEVAMLRAVCWLEFSGKFRTIELASRTVYEAAFMGMMLDSYYGWASPVKLSVTSLNGKKDERLDYLWRYPKNKWVNIPIWEFAVSPENVGEVTFSLLNQGPEWKICMVVMALSFRPKK